MSTSLGCLLSRYSVPTGHRSPKKCAPLSSGALPIKCHASLGEKSSMVTMEDLIQVGVIGGTHGVRGEVRVRPTSDFAEERLSGAGTKWIAPATGRLLQSEQALSQIESLGGRPHIHKGHSLWILRFKGVDNCEQAGLLNGCPLLIHRDERSTLPEGEFYIQELIGLKVIFQSNGEMVGHVDSVYPGEGAPDILIIHSHDRPKSKAALLPFVDSMIASIDIAKGEIFITPPEGLID